MTRKRPDADEFEALVAQLRRAKKYRAVGVTEDTIRDILRTELERQPNIKAALHSAKRKLHEVVALYLGDPDYDAAEAELAAACASGDADAIRATCAAIMETHHSTRERLPLLDTFYPRIWEVTGRPRAVLDLACGLNPLAVPWMDLPPDAHFYAYELHERRAAFLARALALLGVAGGSFARDILVQPPAERGDVALLLKEIHRMEKRRRGIVLPLLDALNVRWIVLSSPTRSRSGRRAVKETYRQQVHAILAARPWRVVELDFPGELVYCVDKSPKTENVRGREPKR